MINWLGWIGIGIIGTLVLLALFGLYYLIMFWDSQEIRRSTTQEIIQKHLILLLIIGIPLLMYFGGVIDYLENL